jgi:hypothetical protein
VPAPQFDTENSQRLTKRIILAGRFRHSTLPNHDGCVEAAAPGLRQDHDSLSAVELNVRRVFLGDGSDLGLKFSYATQDHPRSLGDPFIVGRQFVGDGRWNSGSWGIEMTRMSRIRLRHWGELDTDRAASFRFLPVSTDEVYGLYHTGTRQRPTRPARHRPTTWSEPGERPTNCRRL